MAQNMVCVVHVLCEFEKSVCSAPIEWSVFPLGQLLGIFM